MEVVELSGTKFLVLHVAPDEAQLQVMTLAHCDTSILYFYYYDFHEQNREFLDNLAEYRNLIAVFDVHDRHGYGYSYRYSDQPRHHYREAFLLKQDNAFLPNFGTGLSSTGTEPPVEHMSIQIFDTHIVTDAYFRSRKLSLLLS